MSARGLNILFTTWDGGGVVPPTIEAAKRLMARGHSARIMGDETLRFAVERAGIAFTPGARRRSAATPRARTIRCRTGSMTARWAASCGCAT